MKLSTWNVIGIRAALNKGLRAGGIQMTRMWNSLPRLLIPLLTIAFLSNCSLLCRGGGEIVTKIIVVRPQESSGEVVSAQVVFPGVPYAEYNPPPEGILPLVDPGRTQDVPLSWYTERFKDGTLRITWTGYQNGQEIPYLCEEGFNFVKVPRDRIKVISDRGKIGPPMQPVKVIMGGNTAYLPKRDRETP